MSTLKIVLADDHDAFRGTIASFLRAQRDVTVVAEAADGNEAIEQVEKTHPDLVLMDLEMPNCNGLQATREIKQRLPETRVIIVSIHAGEIYHRMALEHRADGSIDKRALKQGLLDLVASVHENRFATTAA